MSTATGRSGAAGAAPRGAGRLAGVWAPVLVILLWAVVGVRFSSTLFPNFDLLNDFENAHALLHEGRIPQAGSISSFGAINPPGVSYGMVPGILLGGDTPGKANRLGAVFWFSLSVAGLFLFMRRRFGARAAALATLVYGLGAPGVFFAQSLWPRAHPAFLVWFVYFADRWCVDRDARSLAPLIAVAAFALYWMLEFLPALLVLPVLLLVHRPPLRAVPLAAGLLAALVIWAPYLSLQWRAGFTDLRALLTQTEVDEDLKRNPVERAGIEGLEMVRQRPPGWDSWFRDDPEQVSPGPPQVILREDGRFGSVRVQPRKARVDGLPGHHFFSGKDRRWYFQSDDTFKIHTPGEGWEAQPHPVRLHDGLSLRERPRFIESDRWQVVLLENFTSGVWPGAWPLFFWVLFLWACLHLAARRECASFAWRRDGWLALLALAVLAWSVACLLLPGGKTFPATLLSAGLLAVAPAAWAAMRLARGSRLAALREHMGRRAPGLASPAAALVLFLAVPWAVIAFAVWNSDWPFAGRRFLWLSILQAAVLAAVAADLARGLRLPRAAAVVGILILALPFAANTRLVAELGRFRQPDRGAHVHPFEILDWVAEYCAGRGLHEIAIGYDMPFKQFHIHWQPIDPRYKVGRAMDATLWFEHGIRNTNTLPAGVAPGDELILVDKWAPPVPSDRYWDLRHFPRRPVLLESGRWVVLGPPAQPDSLDP